MLYGNGLHFSAINFIFFDIIQKRTVTLVGRGYYTYGIFFNFCGKTLIHHVGITTLCGKTLDLWWIITVFQINTQVPSDLR